MRFVFHVFQLCVVVAAIVGLGFFTPAFAQNVDVTSRLDANEVELGDTVTYTLEANSAGEMPSDPRLDATRREEILSELGQARAAKKLEWHPATRRHALGRGIASTQPSESWVSEGRPGGTMARRTEVLAHMFGGSPPMAENI